MARDMASSFNHLYGEHLVLPEAEVDDAVALLPGLDGRKMSKSYDNTIPLFAPREQMRKLIMGIVTDSRAPGEPKDTEGSALFQIYQAFASADETAALRKAYAEGIAWGDAKQMLFERIDREIAPMRAKYEAMMADPAQVERILLAGAQKARTLATPLMRELREAVGLRNLAMQGNAAAQAKAVKTAAPQIKQYREADGQFYFKIVAADGSLLLQSPGFANPREPGQLIGQLKAGDAAAAAKVQGWWQPGADGAAALAALAAAAASAAESSS
jgi:tryptophanyl-tRNA synthetase